MPPYTFSDSVYNHPKYKFDDYEEHIATDIYTGHSHASIKINREERQYSVGFDPSYHPYVFFAQVKINGKNILEARGIDPVSAVLTLTFILATNNKSQLRDAEHLNRALNKYENFVSKNKAIRDSQTRRRRPRRQ